MLTRFGFKQNASEDTSPVSDRRSDMAEPALDAVAEIPILSPLYSVSILFPEQYAVVRYRKVMKTVDKKKVAAVRTR
jgi:hypothetical protein